MIEDKFGAELLGLQLPMSSLGRLPPLQAAEANISACLYSVLPDFPTLSSPYLLLHRGWQAALPGWPSCTSGWLS